MESFNYNTAEGDNLSKLAHKFYGGNKGIQILIDANPAVPIEAVFPLGTNLIIPIVEQEETTDKSSLPPWKQ